MLYFLTDGGSMQMKKKRKTDVDEGLTVFIR